MNYLTTQTCQQYGNTDLQLVRSSNVSAIHKSSASNWKWKPRSKLHSVTLWKESQYPSIAKNFCNIRYLRQFQYDCHFTIYKHQHSSFFACPSTSVILKSVCKFEKIHPLQETLGNSVNPYLCITFSQPLLSEDMLKTSQSYNYSLELSILVKPVC